jgi:hypothetical protein
MSGEFSLAASEHRAVTLLEYGRRRMVNARPSYDGASFFNAGVTDLSASGEAQYPE